MADLIESGAALTDIVDSHGRAVHEDAEVIRELVDAKRQDTVDDLIFLDEELLAVIFNR